MLCLLTLWNAIAYADYAHESTGFPTWHRQYLLWLEWELQYMLKETQPNTYHTFRLHYWDWRKEQQTSENSPFVSDRLGVTTDNGSVQFMINRHRVTTVNGSVRIDLVRSTIGWETRCWNVKPQICNPNVNTGSLRRCPIPDSGEDPCRYDNPLWPTINDVNNAVGMSSYDGSTYDKFSTSGFRNYMEGFDVLTDDQAGQCAENVLCACETGDPKHLCRSDRGSQASRPITRLLHNSVSQSNIYGALPNYFWKN
jgi:hypothetical protein